MTIRSMRRRWLVAAFSLLAGVVSLAHPTWASDHEDAPSLVTDRGVDIADVFAFMRPGSSSHLVLSMTVSPGAGSDDRFEPGVEYVFRLVGYDPTAKALDPLLTNVQVACRFQSPQGSAQLVVCNANGFSTFATVGDVASDAGAASPLRVFAGLRADPAFADVGRLTSTVEGGHLAFVDAGTNFFAGKNVLAIVVEVAVDEVLLAGRDVSGGRPLFGVSARVERP